MGAIETGKEIVKLAKHLGNIEIQQKVIELQGEILDLQQELQTLRKDKEDLKDASSIDKDLYLKDGAYFRRSLPADSRKGPFCTRCWDTQRKLVTMHSTEDSALWCGECKHAYPTDASRGAERKARQPRKVVFKAH